MTKHVWVIEQGCYSDYRVVGVYDNAMDAERVCDAINRGEEYEKATVAKWELNPGIGHLNAGRKPFRIVMDVYGKVERCEASKLSSYSLDGGLRVWDRPSAPAYKGSNIKQAVHGTVWATDVTHAIKIAHEFRVQAIAEGRMAGKVVRK